MLKLLEQIAANVRAQEYQNARALGYCVGAAIDMSWIAFYEVKELGRQAILENEK